MIKTGIHIGTIIKNILSDKGISKAQLSRLLDVKPQSVDYLLTRKSIDTDTLYAISVALDYDFAALYLLKDNHTNFDEKISKKMIKTKLTFEIELTSKEIESLNLTEKGIDLIKNINSMKLIDK